MVFIFANTCVPCGDQALVHIYRIHKSDKAIRAFAMVKRECLGIVLGNGTSGAARRKSANLFAKEMRQEYYNCCYGGRFD